MEHYDYKNLNNSRLMNFKIYRRKENRKMSNSPLKDLLTKKKLEALNIQVNAFKEGVEASEVAKSYINAVDEIIALCEKRKRY